MNKPEKFNIRDEYNINSWVNTFKKMQKYFTDEIPLESVKIDDPKYYRYKCRGNYFQAVLEKFENLIVEYKLVKDASLVKKIEEIIEFISAEMDFSKKTTKEEIDRVSQVVDDIINFYQ